MKSTIISMLIVLIMLVILPIILFGDNEISRKLGFSPGGDTADTIEKLQGKAPQNIEAVVTDKEVEVYKWIDDNGIMQFSSLPPHEGIEAEIMLLSPNTNVMDATKVPEKEPEHASKPKVFSVGSPYSPEGMKNIVDDSAELQETLNQRQVDQDKMMQDLFPKK